jgi:hypothetical protein
MKSKGTALVRLVDLRRIGVPRRGAEARSGDLPVYTEGDTGVGGLVRPVSGRARAISNSCLK